MKILFLGNDKRYDILLDILKEKYDVYAIDYEYRNDIKKGDISSLNVYDIIVLPMSGIKDNKVGNIRIDKSIFDSYRGIIYTGIKKNLRGNIISFLDDEDIVLENTLITVDGIIDRIKDINRNNICILGYGNIGYKLYNKICKEYNVYIGVKDKGEDILNCSFITSNYKDMEKIIMSSDLVINTVAANIIPSYILSKYKGYFLDIASAPYAINQEDINNYSFEYELYSSIPSKYDPKRAGKILLKKF